MDGDSTFQGAGAPQASPSAPPPRLCAQHVQNSPPADLCLDSECWGTGCLVTVCPSLPPPTGKEPSGVWGAAKLALPALSYLL